MKCSWECYKRSAPRCVSVCAHVRSRVGMGVCMGGVCVCVCHHHSPVDSFFCVYESICMLTPLNDCDYIRQYFTVNYRVFCIKNGIVFPYNFLSSPRKKKSNAFTWYANSHPTINNKWNVGKNVVFVCWSKLFKRKNENLGTLICRKRQFILSYMQMITLLSSSLTRYENCYSTIKSTLAYKQFKYLDSKFETRKFANIILVCRDDKRFHLQCLSLFYHE